MKILWLFNHPAPYKIDFFNELGEKCDLHVVFERLSEGDRTKEFYYEKAISFKETILPSFRMGNYNNYAPKMISLLKKTPYDIVVINGWSTLTEMKAIRYLKHHKIPYIFAINGGIVRDNDPQWKARLKRKYLPGAKAYLSPDEHSSSYLTYYGVDPSKIKLFPYSTIFEKEITEKPLPAIEKKAEREKEGIPGEELYLSVGSFIPRKNDQELLSLWTKTGKEKTLMLIGEGEEKARYQSFIQEHQLNNVLIRPFMPHSEILRYFRMADASIFLTKEDVYGHVVNECLSQGTPVIASDKANSARKLVQNGVDGYLVDITNEQELLKVFASPLTEQMGQNAIQTARQNTIEEMTSAHLKIFEEYLKA